MVDRRQPRLVFVTGPSGSGKTTLIERLVPILRARGLRVGTLKHAHHGFDMDRPGKDSWRHVQAGAEVVCVIAPQQAAWLMETTQELPVEQAVRPMRGRVDLVLVEGFKHVAEYPAICLGHRAQPGLTFGRDDGRCRVAPPAATLAPDDLERIVEFCLAPTQERHTCPPRRHPR